MGQRRKKRYQSKGNPYPPLTMTGVSRLLHHEESYGNSLQAGDIQFFMFKDSLGREKDDPGYEYIGGSGYLKAEIYDGKNWQLVVMDTLFENKEHHFNKSEMPLATYELCAERVRQLAGSVLYRAYRSHYELTANGNQEE